MTTQEISGNSLYKKLKSITLGGTTCLYSEEKCNYYAPLINQINALKKEKNAIILAHSYVSPEIIHGVADVVGDSFELSIKAKETKADIIIFAAVKFMAETAKLLNPKKEVYCPSSHNGCSLADSISASQVIELRKKHPKHTFVCYINTSAAVKAACDVCVTSSNAFEIIKQIKNRNIYFLPDKLMAQNLINQCKTENIIKQIDYWDGSCYVHETYDNDMLDYIKVKHPKAKLVAHPECPPHIVQKADFLGSTSQMVNYVNKAPQKEFFLLTECGLTSRLQLESPHKKFIGSCTLCQYMKANSLENILNTLKFTQNAAKITLNKNTEKDALGCIDNMFKFAKAPERV